MHRDRFTSRKTLSPYACNDDDDGPSYLRHCRAGRCNPNRSTTQRNTMASQWKSCWKRALPVQYQVRNTPFTIMENNKSPLVRDHRYLSSLSSLPMYNHVNYCNRTQLNTSCRQHKHTVVSPHFLYTRLYLPCISTSSNTTAPVWTGTNTQSLSLLISYIHVYIYHVYLPPRTLLLQYGQAQTHKVCHSLFPIYTSISTMYIYLSNTTAPVWKGTNTQSLSLLISYVHVYIYHVYLPPRTLLLQYGQAQTHKVVCLSSFPSWRPKGLLAFDLSLKTPSAHPDRERERNSVE